MPSVALPHPDTMPVPYLSDLPTKDASPFEIDFSISSSFHELDQMIFGPLDFEDANPIQISSNPFSWDSSAVIEADVKPTYGFSPTSSPFNYDFDASQPSPSQAFYTLGGLYNFAEDAPNSVPLDLSAWATDPEPTSFAALHPLPRSVPPSLPFEDVIPPRDIYLQTPSWAAQLWDAPSASQTQNHRSLSSQALFQPSSVPFHSETRIPAMTRTYSKRADSVSVSDNHDATIRRRKRPSKEETPAAKENVIPSNSVLCPSKHAPSTWQLYFAEWIQKYPASGTRKLNVAQAAKEAGQEYARLSASEKEPYKLRAQAMKDAREKEHELHIHTLVPEHIKRENLLRAAQRKNTFRAARRKAGKSHKSNVNDSNAPKKPLSACHTRPTRADTDFTGSHTSAHHHQRHGDSEYHLDERDRSKPEYCNGADLDSPPSLNRSPSMIEGRDITVHGGNFTSVSGDYHEHNYTTVILNDSEKGSGPLDFLKGTFSKLDDLVGLLQRKITGNDTGSSSSTAADSEREEVNGADRSNEEDKLHFSSLNDPPLPTSRSLLNEEYLIYQSQTPRTPATNSVDWCSTHSSGSNSCCSFSSSTYQPENSGQPSPYGMGMGMSTLPQQVVHYALCRLPSWTVYGCQWFASWINVAWVSPLSWACPMSMLSPSSWTWPLHA